MLSRTRGVCVCVLLLEGEGAVNNSGPLKALGLGFSGFYFPGF